MLDVILALDTLRFAWHRVEGNRGKAGGDGITISRFALRRDFNLLAIADEVAAGTYRPGPPRRVAIRTGAKLRTLDILPLRDRVLQRAALDVLTPAVDPRFLPASFGYRTGRSLQDAIARIVRLRDRGLTWVVDADITNCFPSLDHTLLAGFVAELVPDPAVRRLMRVWIDGVLADEPPPRTRGILLGAPISPLLCNIYLHHLDASLHRRRYQLVRYADDFVLLCKSQAHAERALRATEKVLSGLKLALHPRKTRIVSFDDGFDFLGVHFERDDYHYEVAGKRITVDVLPPDFFHYHADGYL